MTAESGVGKMSQGYRKSLWNYKFNKGHRNNRHVGHQTKVKLFSPDNPTTKGSDKGSYTFAFANMAVEDGQKFTVCTISTDNFKLKCENGNNSPLDRPEFVEINVSENPSKKEK